MLEENVVMIIV